MLYALNILTANQSVPALLFVSTCLSMHIHVVEFIGTNVNCNTVFPFVHFKCADFLEISPSLQRSE